jgi:hypothetical protein
MSPKKSVRVDKEGQELIQVSTWVPATFFEALKKFASPDLGSRWEGVVLRRVIREWLEAHSSKK